MIKYPLLENKKSIESMINSISLLIKHVRIQNQNCEFEVDLNKCEVISDTKYFCSRNVKIPPYLLLNYFDDKLL